MTRGKDNKATRDDLKEIGIKKPLWVKVNNNNGKVNKQAFCLYNNIISIIMVYNY